MEGSVHDKVTEMIQNMNLCDCGSKSTPSRVICNECVKNWIPRKSEKILSLIREEVLKEVNKIEELNVDYSDFSDEALSKKSVIETITKLLS